MFGKIKIWKYMGKRFFLKVENSGNQYNIENAINSLFLKVGSLQAPDKTSNLKRDGFGGEKQSVTFHYFPITKAPSFTAKQLPHLRLGGPMSEGRPRVFPAGGQLFPQRPGCACPAPFKSRGVQGRTSHSPSAESAPAYVLCLRSHWGK